MARRLEDNMGAEALKAATGRDRQEWRDLLDAAGARDWSHADTARWLVDEQGLDGWWAQGVTVDYEQARKGRLPGQRADGTFATSTTKTVLGERLDALARVADVVSARHGERHGQNLSASMPIVRWRPDDGTRVSAAAGVPNKSGTPVTITVEKLPSREAMTKANAAAKELLERAAKGEA